MHAFLITGNNKTYIDKFLKDQDAKIINFSLQKIEDSKNLKIITKYSFPEKTVIVLENIDKATPETTNSILKNIEEPNKNLSYVLTAKSLDNVLPTIISRCQIINSNIKNKDNDNSSSNNMIKEIDEESLKIVDDFIKMDINNKFKMIEKIKDRKEAINFLENLILLKHSNKDFKNLENYLETLKNLNKNGNVSLQLTNLLVTSFS